MSFLTNPIQTARSAYSKYLGAGESPEYDEASQNGGQPGEEEEPPLSTQLKFSDAEMAALCMRIERDRADADDDHQIRKDREAAQERDWRDAVGMSGGEDGASNFRVPLITAILMAKHGREVDALFGSNPSVDATPRGPTDAKVSKRVSLAMQWQVYENMRALRPLALVCLRRLKHGRAYAYVPHGKKFFTRTAVDDDPKSETFGRRVTKRQIYWEGPEVNPLTNDDIILPASLGGTNNADNLQTCEFIIHRYWDTLTNMLMLESEPDGPQNEAGDSYQNISKNWAELVLIARRGVFYESNRDQSRIERDRAEGSQRDGGSHKPEQVEIHKWHGRWRKWAEQTEKGKKNGEYADLSMGGTVAAEDQEGKETANSDGQSQSPAIAGNVEPAAEGDEYLEAGGEAKELAYAGADSGMTFDGGTFVDPADGIRKEMIETELIVRKVAGSNLIVGIQDASEVYPDSPNKRPFWTTALMNDGQWHCQGLIELAKNIERELTQLANKGIEALDMSIFPPLIVDPAMGQNMAKNKYGPRELIYSTNPQGAKQVEVRVDMSSFPVLWQMFMSLQEMLTGVTQGVMGRGMDQPNAPRTLGGQRLVMGAADVRLALDMRMLSEDLKDLLDWIWDLWTMFGSEGQFYRVAEGDAPKGEFEHGEMENGFAKLGDKERQGRYDFSLKFADDAQVKEGKKQEALSLLTASLSSPYVQSNPVVQYRLLCDVFEAFGLDFTKYSAEPPPPFLPMLPEEEWTLALEGEDLHVHPLDNDEAHIEDHTMRISTMLHAKPEDQDQDAMIRMGEHRAEHIEALKQKRQTQELMQGIAGMMSAAKLGMDSGHEDPLNAVLQAGMQGAGGIPAQPGQSQQPQGGVIGG